MRIVLLLTVLAQSLIFLAFSKPNDTPNLSTSEFNALYDLYNSTSGRYWSWRNESYGEKWNFQQVNPNPCSENWQGITCQCNNEVCTLKALYLSAYNLKGVLPESIGNWKEISLLNVQYNYIRGQIPESISDWSQIREFNVGHNLLSGSIPHSLWSLTNLSDLNLDRNFFAPSFLPESIGDLTNLRILKMSDINLFGTIPATIINCRKIERLYFGYNKLVGYIPKVIGNLKYLYVIYLNDNYFTGINDNFFNATSLQEFHIYGNMISGTLSNRISNLVSLVAFDISDNLFYGTLPSTMQQIPSLEYVLINSNRFTGTVPEWLSNLTTLVRFSANFNDFYRTLPQSLAKIEYLNEFTISNNLLSGSIPSSYQNLSYLQSLDLSYNSMYGSPNVLFDGCYSLKYLLLGYNFFSGNVNNSESKQLAAIDLPSNEFSGAPPYFDFADKRLLKYLNFGRNYFSGELPLNLPDSLRILLVGENYLHGIIPKYILTSLSIFTLNISFNLFSGHFPEGNSSINVKFEELIVNNNFFVGSLPSSIGYFVKLVSLSFNSNQFTSTVPQSYKNLSELEQFFIQDNLISGSVTELLNNILSASLSAIDLSNNQLTGSLVESFFVNSTLRTFAAVSNCFSGSIPLTVCNAKSLTTFAIDGVSTAQNCREMIYPIFFSGFIVEQYLTGRIPDCLFALPSLRTLHLSGNSFTGTISKGLNISASLIDLSLSHNSLSGTIPLVIQERQWENLDLSYNKLTGTLSSTFSDISNNGSLSLQVNRLSGFIPNSLLSARAINILDGNIFTCNTIAELPSNDPNRKTYSCGSNTVNDLLYFWLSLFLVGLFFLLIYWNKWKTLRNADGELRDKFHNFILNCGIIGIPLLELKNWNYDVDDYRANNPNSNLVALLGTFEGIRRVCIIICFLAIFVLLPVYLGLSENSKTYEEGYVWVISGVLLSGTKSALTLFFVFLLLLLLLFVLLFLTFGGSVPFILKFLADKIVITERFIASNKVQSLQETDAGRMLANQMTYPLLYFTHFVVFILNFVIVGTVDCCYVVVVLNETSTVIIFAALFLACFRLINGKILLWKAIPLVSKIIKLGVSTISIREHVENEVADRIKQTKAEKNYRYDFTHTDIIFLERMMIFNNIVLPIIVIVVILPDCFYNTFVTASNVNANYQYIGCQIYQQTLYFITYYFLHKSICTPVTAYTSFSPPFIYLYQCSSKVVINYIPVYIIKFILAGFVIPSYTAIIKCLYDRYDSNIGNETDTKNSSINSYLFTAFDYLVNRKLRNYLNVSASIDNHQPRMLFDKLKFTVDLSSYFVIIVCFGALFPPLMLIGSITIIIITYFEELMIRRILYESKKKHLGWCEKILEQDCYGVKDLFRTTIWKSTIVVSCCLFAFILFDTWGDEEGWLSALPISLTMMCFPISCILMIQFLSRRYSSNSNSGEPSNILEIETEMVTVNVIHRENTEDKTVQLKHEIAKVDIPEK
jgi:hypothetical protein